MPLSSVYDYTDKLKELLGQCGKVKDISLEFMEISDNADRVKFVRELLKEHNLIVEGRLKLAKTNAIAEACRAKGNQFYSKKEFLDALEAYNQSLCFAEPGSQTIGLAYANRSAVFYELKLYASSLKNIQLAKDNDYPSENYEKLEKRQVQCIQMINSSVKNDDVPIGREFLKLILKPNEKLPFLADCLELKCDDRFGRYVTTKVLLKPGDVVCVEEPFSKILLPSHRYKYCATCLNDKFLDLIACNNCTFTMFCSDECAIIGNDKFHKYECAIVDKLNSLATKILRISVRTFFEALHVCNGSFNELKALIEKNRDSGITIFDFETLMTPKNVLQAVDALAANEESRSKADLFQRSGTVAIICDLLIDHTNVRDLIATDDDRDFFYRFIFKQTQIAACNYHGLYNGVVKMSEINSNPQYGSGSFPFCSMMNHSCSPNLVRVTSENKNYVVINRPVMPGGQLFDNYGFHHCLEEIKARQSTLQSQYMFKCSCEACTLNFPLFPYLPLVDPNIEKFLSDDVKKLSTLDVNRAKIKIRAYCDYLMTTDKQYPCWEISSVQECLLRCFTIFTMSEFKLKLCA